MKDIIKIIKKNPDILTANGCSDDVVLKAEKELQLNFSDEYKIYLLNFGLIAYDGHELTGITKTERLNVVNVTRDEWNFSPEISHNLYVIEQTHIDNLVIWQNEKGEIFRTFSGEGLEKICDSLSEYIEME